MKKKRWTYSVALDDDRFYNYLVSIMQCGIAPLSPITSKNILFCSKTTKIKFDIKYKELGFTLTD
ncbi:hypothetical protein [Nitrosopumilus sp.]|uniref:hypothetical protein n=1 Tax=Nitrosopumilus sp. TaxID=2024843 RepID=UPI00293161DD|nr:hypothetical protein [Nitrosopumilus sp.]